MSAIMKSHKVLIVDDCATTRSHLRFVLQKQHISVIESKSVDEALIHVLQEDVDCVFMDITMPDKDGYEGCRLIKAVKKDSPVIMLTGKKSPFDKIKGKFSGCDDYITKPADASVILSTLSKYIELPTKERAPITSSDTAFKNECNYDCKITPFGKQALLSHKSNLTVKQRQFLLLASNNNSEVINRTICKKIAEKVDIQKLSELGFIKIEN